MTKRDGSEVELWSVTSEYRLVRLGHLGGTILTLTVLEVRMGSSTLVLFDCTIVEVVGGS